MLLLGPYLVETTIWVISTTVIAIWVTRIYINSIFAVGFGKIKEVEDDPPPKKHIGSTPFVTVFVPVYNEFRVIDRIMKAVTSIRYPNYEIIVADDSTESSMLNRLDRWKKNRKVKIVHRDKRTGFKAGAINNAIKYANPRSKYLLFFDADYVPESGIVWRMLSDFKGVGVAAVQGYTKHTLNASQNSLTKSTSLAFSAYCLVDMPMRKRLGGFIPLAGSVFMITKSSFAKMGGFDETSVTEDWALSCSLAEHGYRIVYDETISVPAECPSTFSALLKQQMRWAEGIARDTKRHFLAMLSSKRTNAMKKFDYLFYGFSSMNGVFGSLSYVLTFIVFLINQRILIILGVDRNLILSLGLYGQLLLFIAPMYIPLALILSAFVGLYRESRLPQFRWCVYLFAVTLALTPFIAFAGIKGLLLKRGSWSRTPKTGKLTIPPNPRTAG